MTTGTRRSCGRGPGGHRVGSDFMLQTLGQAQQWVLLHGSSAVQVQAEGCC